MSQALPDPIKAAAASAGPQWGEAVPLFHLYEGVHSAGPPEHPQEALAPRPGGVGGRGPGRGHGYRGLGGGDPRYSRALSFTPPSLHPSSASYHVFAIGICSVLRSTYTPAVSYKTDNQMS